MLQVRDSDTNLLFGFLERDGAAPHLLYQSCNATWRLPLTLPANKLLSMRGTSHLYLSATKGCITLCVNVSHDVRSWQCASSWRRMEKCSRALMHVHLCISAVTYSYACTSGQKLSLILDGPGMCETCMSSYVYTQACTHACMSSPCMDVSIIWVYSGVHVYL